MQLLSFIIETSKSTGVHSTSIVAMLLAAVGAYQTRTVFAGAKKQLRKLKWMALKQRFFSLFSPKKEKGKGAIILMLLLLLIGGAAVLWILWELGGIFALILGIVGLLGMISIFMRMQ